MAYYEGFPPALSSPATAAGSDLPKQPTYPTVQSSQTPSPVKDTARDSPMDPAGKRPVPGDTTVQDHGLNGSSTNKPEQACEGCRFLRRRCDGSSYSIEGHGHEKGRCSSHEYQDHLQWRYQVTKAWISLDKHDGCPFANSFFTHGTKPCDKGWGKALHEHMYLHGKRRMETDAPEVILEEYRGRHVHEERHQSLELELEDTGNSENRIWKLCPTGQQQQWQQQPGQREQGQPSASSYPYREV
ncbi:hypothetical protein M436DRAFT_81557 [Aureobasidium namibiae CBS 147.97]|uniref:Uncharacterized protein n=1 Tax=Aureobasidium namibiae CBS 147.97 TaxID=1043004 RepID=A0A074XF01_9PEZI